MTIIETASGKLVDKKITDNSDTELRHLAAVDRAAIFAIQARLGEKNSALGDETTPGGETRAEAPLARPVAETRPMPSRVMAIGSPPVQPGGEGTAAAAR